MRTALIIALCVVVLVPIVAAQEPRDMSIGCKASYDSAIPALIADFGNALYEGNSVENDGDGTSAFAAQMQPVILDPYGSGAPKMVMGLFDHYTIPICVAGDNDHRAYIPLDTISGALFWDVDSSRETGNVAGVVYFDFRPGSKDWRAVVEAMENALPKGAKVKHPALYQEAKTKLESFRFLEVTFTYDRLKNQIRTSKDPLWISGSGRLMFFPVSSSDAAVLSAGWKAALLSRFLSPQNFVGNVELLLHRAVNDPNVRQLMNGR